MNVEFRNTCRLRERAIALPQIVAPFGQDISLFFVLHEISCFAVRFQQKKRSGADGNSAHESDRDDRRRNSAQPETKPRFGIFGTVKPSQQILNFGAVDVDRFGELSLAATHLARALDRLIVANLVIRQIYEHQR